jgi:hypothetical protein
LRDSSNSKYNLEIDYQMFQSDLEYGEVSNIIKITGDKAVISLNNHSGSETCSMDFSLLPYNWRMNDWILVFDMSNKQKCTLRPLNIMMAEE